MMIVLEKSEDKLIEYINGLKNDLSKTRCIFLELSKSHKDLPFDNLADMINTCIDDTSGKIFICYDGDAFLVSPGITTKKFEFLKNQLQNLTGANSELENSEAAHIFDIQTEWFKPISIVEEKIKTIQTKRREAERRQQEALREKRRQELLAYPINPEQITKLAEQRKTRSKPHVLFVEDDSFTRKLAGGVLENHVLTVYAQDGREAVRQYAADLPNIVFLDIDLPDVTGHDVLEKIMQFDREAFVVILSGNGNKDNIVRALSRGAKGFISKPFTRERMLKYIDMYVKQQDE
jgi:two-component system chemotaxis response regulator CheY